MTPRRPGSINSARPLLIGELNPGAWHHDWDLWPHPVGCAGWRLCYRILGMSEYQYCKTFDRLNLCAGRWDREKAVLSANTILLGYAGGRVVLLGQKVTKAFASCLETPGFGYYPFTIFPSRDELSEPSILVLPHPSGRCRLWNEPASIPMARETVARFLEGAEE